MKIAKQKHRHRKIEPDFWKILKGEKTIEEQKGASWADVGYFYAPYVPLMTAGNIIVDTPTIGFKTRYGISTTTPTS